MSHLLRFYRYVPTSLLLVESTQQQIHQVTHCAATLTGREREVCQYVIAGMLNKQIAGELGTSEKTVKVHRGRVMQKMEADSLADLVRMAEKAGIGRPES